MRYEVHFGGFTHWCEASTPLQAGLITLNACIEQYKTFAQLPMLVIALETGDETTVGLAEVLWVKHHAAQELPREPSEQAELDMETQWMQEEISCLPSSSQLVGGAS